MKKPMQTLTSIFKASLSGKRIAANSLNHLKLSIMDMKHEEHQHTKKMSTTMYKKPAVIIMLSFIAM